MKIHRREGGKAMTTLRATIGAALVLVAFGAALAKLPPPPPMTEEQKAEKAAKEKAAADLANEQLARAQDRVAARYIAQEKAKGVTVTPQMGPSSGAAGKAAATAPQKAASGNAPASK
jgi:hypothetical protein